MRFENLESREIAVVGDESVDFSLAAPIERHDQPEEAILEGAGAIARRGLGAAMGMRMIAADDPALRAAKLTQERDVLRGIELEAIGLFGHIRHWVKRGDANLRAVA